MFSLFLQASIFEMFRELFSAAVGEDYPCGLPASPQSRAMYAVDLMLAWDKNNDGKSCKHSHSKAKAKMPEKYEDEIN